VRLDRENQTCLVPPAVPWIWGPEVPLGELLDVLSGSLAGDAQDRTPNRVVPGWVARVRDGHRDARIPPDVLDLLEPFDGVDQNVRTICVDPGIVRHSPGGLTDAVAGDRRSVTGSRVVTDSFGSVSWSLRAYPSKSSRYVQGES
jgi:hypothetical protein